MEVWLPKGAGQKQGSYRRSGGVPAQAQAQQGARGQGVSNKSGNKRPPPGRRWWLDPITPSYPTHYGGGGRWMGRPFWTFLAW